MDNMTAAELMEKFPDTVSPETDIHSAIAFLLKKKLTGAPVVDAERRVIGILSEKDCLKIVTFSAFERLPEGKVRDYMTKTVLTVTGRNTLNEVADRFLQSSFRRLPVVDEDGRLQGVVSRTDVVKAISSMRDNPSLYKTPEPGPPRDETPGVDSAMRHARAKRD